MFHFVVPQQKLGRMQAELQESRSNIRYYFEVSCVFSIRYLTYQEYDPTQCNLWTHYPKNGGSPVINLNNREITGLITPQRKITTTKNILQTIKTIGNEKK